MEHNEGFPILFMKFYTMYEDGDEEACKTIVEMHSAGQQKERVIAVLQEYIETDIEKLRELCEEKTVVCFGLKQKEEGEKLFQELQAAGANVKLSVEDEETEL